MLTIAYEKGLRTPHDADDSLGSTTAGVAVAHEHV